MMVPNESFDGIHFPSVPLHGHPELTFPVPYNYPELTADAIRKLNNEHVRATHSKNFVECVSMEEAVDYFTKIHGPGGSFCVKICATYVEEDLLSNNNFFSEEIWIDEWVIHIFNEFKNAAENKDELVHITFDGYDTTDDYFPVEFNESDYETQKELPLKVSNLEELKKMYNSIGVNSIPDGVVDTLIAVHSGEGPAFWFNFIEGGEYNKQFVKLLDAIRLA